MFPDLTRDDVFRLETRRLWLRWPRLADVQAIVRLAGEKAVAEMTARIPHPYRAGGRGALRLPGPQIQCGRRGAAARHHAEGTPEQPDRRWSGSGRARRRARRISATGSASPHWGQGYATEAARALIDAFFAYGDGSELTASARVINPASRRVLEKCGFAYQGSGLVELPARGGLFPAEHFRLDRRAWESLKTWGHSGFVPRAASDEEPALPLSVLP